MLKKEINISYTKWITNFPKTKDKLTIRSQYVSEYRVKSEVRVGGGRVSVLIGGVKRIFLGMLRCERIDSICCKETLSNSSKIIFKSKIENDIYHLSLTATVDPFLPQPPVKITDAFSNAKMAHTATAPYNGIVFTSIRWPNTDS